MELPEPRGDGKCCGCKRQKAITRDNRFCLRCLRALIDRINPPIPKEITSVFEDGRLYSKEMVGRSYRSAEVLSGSVDMRNTSELDGETEY